jgi:hypothetical protein
MTIPRTSYALCALGLALWALPAHAQKHEVGLLLGGLFGGSRSGGGTNLDLSAGTALQANYGYRLLGAESRMALYGEVHFLANAQRTVDSLNGAATRDVATIYITPGVRLKFFPAAAISPYLVAGGGYAVYEQSLTQLDGQPNGAPRTINRGVFDFGGGVDFKFWRFVGLRAEIRDFYSGSPAYNVSSIIGGQHNVVASGGLVLKFR